MSREAAIRQEDEDDDMGAKFERPQPCWFFNESIPQKRPVVKFQPQLDAEAVRSYWRSKAQTFEEPPEAEPWPGEELLTHAPGDGGHAGAASQRRKVPTSIYVAASVTAFFLGGVGVFVAVDRASNGALTAPALAWAQGMWSDMPSSATTDMITDVVPDPDKKGIVTATLDVADVQGKANTPIPLWLRADPGAPGRDIALKLEGLPSHAWLTTGTRLGSVWLLRPDELKDVKLMIPDAPPAPLALSVSAIEADTGALASPVKELSVLVIPTAAPPQTHRNFAGGSAP